MNGLAKIANAALTGLFDLLVWPFKAMAPIWPILFISLVSGILMLWIFGKVSNQAAIKRTRDLIRGNLIGVRLFQNDVRVLLRLQGRILLDTLRYMKLSLIPMVVMLGPVLLIMIQLNLRYALRPVAPGETIVCKVQVRDAADLAKGVAIETPPGGGRGYPAGADPFGAEVAWRLRIEEPGRYTVRVRVGDSEVEKELVAGSGWASVSPLRTGAGPFEPLLYPGEAPLPASIGIESVALNYPELEVNVFGFTIHWLVLFFILSIVFGFAFKGLLGVEV